jgi:integrase
MRRGSAHRRVREVSSPTSVSTSPPLAPTGMPPTVRGMPRRAGAWGSVRHLKTGYQARIPAVASATHERETIGVYPTKAEADRALRRAEAAFEAKETIPTRRSASGLREVARRRGVPTLTEACDAYISEAQSKGWMFTRYADTNRSLNHRHIRDTPAGQEFVTLVSQGQVRALLDGILEKGLSRSQALQTKALLAKTFERLIEEGQVEGLRRSPVTGARVRSREKGAGSQTPRREPFLPSSLASLVAIAHVVNAYPPQTKGGGAPYSMTTTDFAALVRTLLFGGLRPEEALSLTAQSVRPSGVWVGEVLVIDVVAKGWVLEPPKSGGHGHLVPLPPVTLGMVRDLATARGAGLLWPPRGSKPGDNVRRAHSVPIGPWGRVRAAAGMGPDAARESQWSGGMQVKDLRAVCASMLAATGVTMPEARAHLGHASDGVTTTRHYMRPLEVPEIRVVASRVEGGIVERLTAAERVIDDAAMRAHFGVIGQGKGMARSRSIVG